MNQVTYAKESNQQNQLGVIDSVYRLRHETFINRLGWDITSKNGMERDSFDDLNPYHIAVHDQQGEVNGCWRALPTTGDYMLRSVFSELLQGETVPEGDDIWEISRFAVRKDSGKAVKGYSGGVTVDMIRSLHHFAQAHNIKQYVAVTTVGFERILKKLGLTIRRLGAGASMQIGVERSVAIWVEVNDNMNIAVH